MLITVLFPTDSFFFYIVIIYLSIYLSIYIEFTIIQNEDRPPLHDPNHLRDSRNIRGRQRPSLQGICTYTPPPPLGKPHYRIIAYPMV